MCVDPIPFQAWATLWVEAKAGIYVYCDNEKWTQWHPFSTLFVNTVSGIVIAGGICYMSNECRDDDNRT